MRQDMGTFGSDLRVRLRKLLGRERELLESSLRFLPSPFSKNSCLRTLARWPTPRTRFINILNKIRENLNSSCGRGRWPPGRKYREERKKGTKSEPIYTYDHETVCPRVLDGCVLYVHIYKRTVRGHAKAVHLGLRCSRATACGWQLCGIHFRFRFMFPFYADVCTYGRTLRPNSE